MRILDSMKGKSTSEYTLLETVIAVMACGLAILAGISAIAFIFAAAVSHNGLWFIVSLALAVVCILCIAVVAYVGPDW